MAINAVSYIGNLGKSIAYSAVDKFKEMSPATTELVTTNADLFKEVYTNIRDYRNTYKKTNSWFKQTKVYEASDLFFNSIFEDIKSGKLYNKERIDKIETKIAMGGENSLDSGFDDSQFNMDFDESQFDVNFDEKDLMLVDSIDKSSERNAEMISTTVARTGKYIVESQKTSSHLLYVQNLEAYNLFNNNLSSINTNISSLVNFSSQTLQTHAENSKKYFEETTKLQTEQTELLRQIVSLLGGGPKAEQKEKRKKITIDDILGAEGTPNFKEYANYVKQNFKNQYGHLMPDTGLGGDEANPLLLMVASPLRILPDFIINKMVPDVLDESFRRFDRSVSGFFASLMSKLNDMGQKDNPIISAIGKIFGISSTVKGDLDSSNYTKGKVDWDGKSRKALIEVIPTYLSKILSVLSGKGETRFDYDEGKFVEGKTIKDTLDKRKNSYQKNATSDMRDVFSNVMNNLMKFNSLDDKESLEKDVEAFFKALYDKGGFFDINSKTIEEDYDKYNVSNVKNFRAIRSMFKNAPKYLQQEINKNILEQRSKANKDMNNLEESASSIFQNLFNESGIDEYIERNKKTGEIKSGNGLLGGMNLLKTKDNLGHNIFYYLQNMYKELNFIRRAGSGGGGKNSTPGIIMSDGTTYEDKLDFARDTRISDKSEATKKAHEEREFREKVEAKLLKQQEKIKEKNNREMFIDFSDIDNEKELEARIGASMDIHELNKQIDKKKYKEKTLVDKLLESKTITDKTKTIIEKLNDLSKKPVEFLTNTLDKVDEKLYQAIYGNTKYKGTDVKGFLNVIIFEIKNTFNKFNDWIDEKILKPLKQKFEVDSMKDLGKRVFKNLFGLDFDDVTKSVKTYFFGNKETGERGLFSSIGEGIKDSVKGTFNTIKDSVKTTLSPIRNKFNDIRGKIPRKNKQTGEIEYVDADDEFNSALSTIDSIVNTKSRIENDYTDIGRRKKGKEKDEYLKQRQKELNRLFLLDAKPLDIYKDNLYSYEEGSEKHTKAKNFLDRYNTLASRDFFRNDYTDNISKLLGIENDKDKELLSGAFGQLITSKNVNSTSNLTMKHVIDEIKKKNKYNPLISTLLQYSDMFDNKENTTLDHIIRNNRKLEDNNGGRLSLDDIKESAFMSDEAAMRIKEVNDTLDDTGNVTKSIKSTIDNIFNLLKDIFGHKQEKKSNIILPGDSNYNIFSDPGNEEGKVVDNFSAGLSKSISEYIKRNIKPHAKGTGGLVDRTQVTTIQKDEMVLNKDDSQNFSKIMKYLVNKISSGKGIDDILNHSSDDMTNFINRKDINMKELMSNLKGTDIHNQIASMDKSGIELLKKALVELKNKKIEGDKQGQTLIEQTASEIYNSALKTKTILFGDDKKDSKAFGEVVDDLTYNISKYAPEAVGSGLIGAGVSLLTGAIGGPLLGAAVGAGISLTKNSEKMQNWLFGDKIGDTDERKGGLVSRDTVNTLKKYLPDIKNLGITGGIAGLLPFMPFGPLGGILLGSAFGFAKNTNIVQERMFGKAGVLNDKRRDSIKKFLPKAAMAMVPSLFFGPFGFLGNAVLGSALGILSNTTGFNDFLYGKFNKTTGKYENGVLPAIRDNISNPLQKFFIKLTDRGFDWIEEHIAKPIESAISPLGKQLEVMFSTMIGGVGKYINNMFEKSVGVPLGKFVEDKLIKPFSWAFGKLFKVVLAPAKLAVATPFKMIGALGNAAKKRQIRKGNADYMTAQERNQYREENGGLDTIFKNDNFYKFDQLLEGMSDENVEKVYDKLNLVTNTDKALKEKRYNLKYEIGNEVSGYLGKYSKSKKAMEAITNGDLDKAKDLILEKRIKEKKSDTDIMNKLDLFINNKILDKTANTNKLLDYINKRIDDPKTIRRLTKLIRQEKYKEVMDIIEEKMTQDDKKEKNIIDFLNLKANEYDKLDGSKTDIDSLLNNSYKELNELGFGKLDAKNVDKYLNLLNAEKNNRQKKVQEENDIRVLDKTPEEIEQEKKQEFYKPILNFLEDITDDLDIIKKSYEEIAKNRSINSPNIDQEMNYLHTDKKYKMVSSKNKDTKERLNRSIQRYKDPKAYLEREQEERQSIEDAGLNPNLVPQHAKGGSITKTGLYAGSKGELVLTPENVNTMLNNEAKIPEILEDNNKDEEKRHEGIVSLFNRVINKLDFAFPNKSKKRKMTKIDAQGNPMDYIITSDGEEELDLSDSSTRQVIEENKENKLLQKGIFSKLSSLVDLFGKKKNTDEDEKKENKFGWLDTLLSGLKKAGLIGAGIAATGAFGKYVLPKAEEIWNTNLKPWLDEKVLPWLKEDVGPKIAQLMGEGVKFAIKEGVPALVGGLKWALTDGMPLIVKGVAESVKFAITEMYPALLNAVLDQIGLSGEHGEQSLPGNVAYAVGRDSLTLSSRIPALAQRITNLKPKSRDIMDIVKNPIKGTVVAAGDATVSAGKVATKGLGKFVEKVSSPISKLYQKMDSVKLFGKAASLDELSLKTAMTGKGITESISSAIKNKATQLGYNSLATAAGDAAANNKASQGLIRSILDGVQSFILKLVKAPPVMTLIDSSGAEKIVNSFLPKFLDALGTNIEKSGLKLTGKMAASIGTAGLANIAFSITGFISGYNDCRSILGITDEPTFGMRITTGLIRAISGFFIITSIIPEKLYVDLVLDILLPLFGYEYTDIQQERKEAEKEVAKYNKEHGTKYSVEQYNHEVKGDKSLFGKTKDFFSNGVKKAGEKVQSLYKGYIEIQKFMEVDNTAIDNLLNSDSDDSYWSMPQVDQNNETAPFKTFFFYTNRVMNAPYFYMTKLGRGIVKGARDLYYDFVGINYYMENDDSRVQDLLNSPNGGSYWDMPEEDNSNTVPFKNFFFYTNRVLNSPYYYMSKLGKGIANMGKNIFDEYQSIEKFIDNDSDDIQELLNGNSSKSYWDLPDNDDSPFKKMLFYINRIVNAPAYYIKKLLKGVDFSNVLEWLKSILKEKDNNNNGDTTGTLSIGRGGLGKGNTKKMNNGGLGGSFANGMTYYSQGDSDWSQLPYGSTGTIGSSACGPTSAAMVISSLTGNNITPVDAAKYSVDHGFRIPGIGTSWDYFKNIGNNYGIDFSQTTDQSTILNALKNNQPVIFSGKGEAPFTKGGHFIVGAGLDGDKIKVNDPVSLARSKEYSSSQIFNEMATAFIANKQLGGSNTNNTIQTTASQQEQKPSAFNMINDFGNMISNTFDKIYGFGIGDGDSKVNKLIQFINTKKTPKLAFGGDSISDYTTGTASIADRVLALRSKVEAQAKKYGISDIDLLMALIMQESGGSVYDLANDPMQSAEGHGLNAGQLHDQDKSIAWGVEEFANRLKDTNGNIPLTLQSYNYGPGFINYVKNHGGSMTQDLVNAFADEQARKQGWSSYGDKNYVQHVLRYYKGSGTNVGNIFGTTQSGETQQEKPSIFNMINDFGNMVNNTFDRLYGFNNAMTNAVSGAVPNSVDTTSSNISDNWFTKTIGATKSSDFGPRVVNGQSGVHKGIDYAAKQGTAIKSPVEGKVIQNSFDDGGYGNYLVIQDKNKYHHYFGHMVSPSPLSVGTNVKVGDVIGYVGSTGRSTGPHVHYEVKDPADSQSIEPNKYLQGLYKSSGVQTGGSRSIKPPKIKIPYNAGGDQTDASTRKMPDNSIGNTVLEKLITTIIDILSKIADNTNNLSDIVKILSDGMNIQIPEDKIKNIKSQGGRKQIINILQDTLKSGNSNMDTNDYLIRTLNAIASE